MKNILFDIHLSIEKVSEQRYTYIEHEVIQGKASKYSVKYRKFFDTNDVYNVKWLRISIQMIH